jgi:hypothetical protein
LVLAGVLAVPVTAAAGPVVAVAGASGGAVVGGSGRVQIDGTIGGHDINAADSTNPIRIDPRNQIPIQVTIRNRGKDVVEIRYLRLEGKALGLTFLTYDLGVRTSLEPGEQTAVDTNLDFFDLESQATGYLGASLRAYDVDRHVLGAKSFVVDVRGNATSTLGLFALVIIGVAIFSCFVLIVNTVRRRLPSNRFVRGVQFAMAGSAIGVTLSLGVSILRVAFADVEAWVPIVALPTVIAFALGYVAPGPLSRSLREAREEEALQAAARVAVARASGIHDPASSGGFRPDHASGGFRPDHASGGFVPGRSSSEFVPDRSSAEFVPDRASAEFVPERSSGAHPSPEDRGA